MELNEPLSDQETPGTSRPYAMRQISLAFRRAGAWCGENPLKVYAGLTILGCACMGLNPHAGWMWRAGFALDIASLTIKLAFGKGGEDIDASAFRLTLKDVGSAVWGACTQPLKILTKDYWREARASFAVERKKGVLAKLFRPLAFWRYPMDARWLVSGLGSIFASADVWGRGVASHPMEAALCGAWGVGCATGFLTGNSKNVAPIFSFASGLVVLAGMHPSAFMPPADLSQLVNPTMFFPGLVFVYSNHVLGQASRNHQSRYAEKQLNMSRT